MQDANPYEASGVTPASGILDSGATGRIWLVPWFFGASSMLIAVLITDLIYPLPGPTYAYWIAGLVVAVFASLKVGNRLQTRLAFALGASAISVLQLVPIGYYIAWPYLD